MSNSIIKKTFLSCTLLCVLLVVSCSPTDDDNKNTTDEPILYADGDIYNKSFELGYDDYWQLSTDDNTVAIDEDCAYEDTHSLKIGSDAEYNANVVQYVDGLKPGYYYLEAYTLNEGNQDYCYIYGKGTEQGKCMTAVPKTIKEDTWTKVTVRGIQVAEDGVLELGMCAKGEGQYVNFDSFALKYENNQSAQYESLFGGTISWLDWIEDLGGKYYFSDHTEGDALQIMAENGCNFVRLELYNNPGDYINEYGDRFPKGYKDADSIFDLAVRANDKDMKIQLSFMYADYWGNDCIPSDWLEKIEGIDDHEEIARILTECVYDYTKSFMERLANAGIYPEYVSLGNEMQGGILLPYGATYDSNGAMEAFCSFMDAGYRAVKEVSPYSKIVLHIASNADDMFWEGKSGSGKWFFGLCEEYDIAYDVIGLSFYPHWAQTDDIYAIKSALDTNDFLEWCDMMIDTFDKDILVMETGINWGKPGQLGDNGAYEGIYAYTPEDQRNFMYELINAIKSVKDGRCVGDLYWDPVLVRQEGVGYAINTYTNKPRPNVVETTTFFNYNHVALPVLDAYKYNVVNDSQATLYGTVTDSTGKPLAEHTFVVRFNDKVYTITTDRYGQYYTHVDAGSGEFSISNGTRKDVDFKCGETYRFDF